MTTALTIKHELGDNADLLTKPDQWLENHEHDIATKISIMVDELENIQKARRFKRQLQRANQVAVLLSELGDDGLLRDVALKVMSISDAAKLAATPDGDPDRATMITQFYIWDRNTTGT